MPKGLSTKSNLARCIEYAAGTLSSGIGVKRHELQIALKGQSPLIHSTATFHRYFEVIGNLVDTLKASGINRLDKVTPQAILDYFNKRLDAGAVQSTLKTEISAVNKFVDALGRRDLLITGGDKIWKQAATGGRCYPMDNAQKAIDAIKNPISKAIATIEYNTSSRISECPKIKIDEQNKSVSIRGKGGKNRTISFSDRQEKFQKVIEAKQALERHLESHMWHETRVQAYQDLHKAERATGEIVQGFHGFRASYIAERFDELYERHLQVGMEQREAYRLADEIAGHEAGHERADTTRHYRMA